jgi:putative ATPase
VSSAFMNVPLAERLRPRSFEEFQSDAIKEKVAWDIFLDSSARIPSLLLWGPPGVGKTTLARLIGSRKDLHYRELSAVLDGVKEVREIVTDALRQPVPTLLFVDEIHRFNRSQQDAFLPHIERGTISLIGATTENPSFSLTAALLSRLKLIRLEPLSQLALHSILKRACIVEGITIDDDAADVLIDASHGDARVLLNTIDELQGSLPQKNISTTLLREFLPTHAFRHDKKGDNHYHLISALIKSLRGSSADGALYWAFRMLEGGEEPRFLFRRLIIFASEDIGNADPRALQLALAGADAFERLGLPEGKIPLAHVITYLATAPKSNRSYVALQRAEAIVRAYPRSKVPNHLRPKSSSIASKIGWGEGYRYPHDEEEAFSPGVEYLPNELPRDALYEPSERGYEKTIGERLQYLRRRG